MDIKAMIESLGLPIAYNHYAEGECPAPPFLAYLFPNSNNISADNIVWKSVTEVSLELYTEKKDRKTEQLVEGALTEHGIFWNKSEVYIDSEKLYEVLYSFEMEVD
jgi:hypothetical protein